MSPTELLDAPGSCGAASPLPATTSPDIAAEPGDAGDRVEIIARVTPRKLFRILILAIVLLAAFSALAHYLVGSIAEDRQRGLREIAMRFDMDRENTLPEWFSSLLLASCALMLFSIGAHGRRAGRPFAWHWLFLAVAFGYLSIDESVGMHEILMVPLRRRLNTGGIFYFSWVIVALPLVVMMFLAYLSFLRHLPRRAMRLFVIAGSLYVGGALGMEMVGGALAESGGFYTLPYTIAMMTEETCEMLGAALFLCALIEFHGNLTAAGPGARRLAVQ